MDRRRETGRGGKKERKIRQEAAGRGVACRAGNARIESTMEERERECVCTVASAHLGEHKRQGEGGSSGSAEGWSLKGPLLPYTTAS